MKNGNLIFLILSVSALIFGCSSSRVEKERPKFERVTLKESDSDVSTSVSFAQFFDESLSPLNVAVRNFVYGEKDSFVRECKSEGVRGAFSSSCRIFQDGEIFSVLVMNSGFSGGAHGFVTLESFNFDRRTQKFLNVCEASGLSVREISEISKEQLQKKLGDAFWKDGAGPEISNFSVFSVNGGIVTVYFQQYQVAAYAYGSPTVEFPIK